MSDLVRSREEVYSIKGLDMGDLNLLISGLKRLEGDLRQPDMAKAADLLGVLQ